MLYQTIFLPKRQKKIKRTNTSHAQPRSQVNDASNNEPTNADIERHVSNSKLRVVSLDSKPEHAKLMQHTVASTAVPSSAVFIDEERFSAPNRSNKYGNFIKKTPSKAHTQSKAISSPIRSGLAESIGYVNMSPLIRSQTAPFTAAATSSSIERHPIAPDYSRRRTGGIGARSVIGKSDGNYLNQHISDFDVQSHDPDSKKNNLMLGDKEDVEDYDGDCDHRVNQTAGEDHVCDATTTRLSNKRIFSIAAIAESLKQFNSFGTQHTVRKSKGGYGKKEEDADTAGLSTSSQSCLSSGMSWRIFGWAGKTNLGRRMHPRPTTEKLSSESLPASAAVVSGSVEETSDSSSTLVSPFTSKSYLSPSTCKNDSTSDGSPGSDVNFDDLVSPQRVQHNLSEVTPRSRRQELFASAQKKYKEKLSPPIPLQLGVMDETANDSENYNALLLDQLSKDQQEAYYDQRKKHSPHRIAAGNNRSPLRNRARAIERSPSEIPRLRSGPTFVN